MSRGRIVLAAAVAGCVCCLAPAPAPAARVLVLGPGGHVRAAADPYLGALSPTPSPGDAPAVIREAAARRRAAAPRSTPAAVLVRLLIAGQITSALYAHYRGDVLEAARTLRRLRGTRRDELGAVIANLDKIAGTGRLTASRLPALFLTLERNRQWWATAPLPAGGQRIEFAGSRLVWEYYPGQGIELQVLGTFGKADGLFTAGRAHYGALQQLLGEMIPLAAERGGGLAWEYYFDFDGGAPPWVSAMAQGTALEALTRGYLAAGGTVDPTGGAAPSPTPTAASGYLAIAHRALGILETPPPAGVAIPTGLGRRFLQYSFAPGASIINAFLQTLIGLHDYARTSGDPEAAALFGAGDAEAAAEVPRFDTGAWSLYQPGLEDTLSYHQLVTGFLAELCRRTARPVYCITARRFGADETTPPALALLTGRVRRRRPFVLRFRLSKYSHVGVVVIRGGSTAFATSASFAYGVDAFAIPALPAPGAYVIHLAATDLSGNFARILGSLSVTR